MMRAAQDRSEKDVDGERERERASSCRGRNPLKGSIRAPLRDLSGTCRI